MFFSDHRDIKETLKTVIEEEASAAAEEAPAEAAVFHFSHHLTPALFFIPLLLHVRHYCYTLTFPAEP